MRSKNKYSYGIALCHMINDVPHILLVRRRNTYEFCEFVHGNYNIHDWDKLNKLFNKMTVAEKAEIHSMDFAKMWWKLSLNENISMRCKRRFDEICHERLNITLNDSSNGDLLYEMPKGRPNWCEKAMTAAMRELEEEVNIKPGEYKILFNNYNYHKSEYNVNYHMSFYLAEYIGDGTYNDALCNAFTFNSVQYNEIDFVNWYSADNIRHLNVIDEEYRKLLLKVLKDYRRYKSAAI